MTTNTHPSEYPLPISNTRKVTNPFTRAQRSTKELFIRTSLPALAPHLENPKIHHKKNSPPKQTQHHHATPSPPPKPNAPQKHQTKSTPYNVSSRALAAILSPSLSVYFTSIGRYFFSSFTLPEDLAMRTRFLIAVRSSGLIFNTLL